MGKEFIFLKGKIDFEKGANTDIINSKEAPMWWCRSPSWSDSSFPHRHTDPDLLTRTLRRKATLGPGFACSSCALHSLAAGAVHGDTGTHGIPHQKCIAHSREQSSLLPHGLWKRGTTQNSKGLVYARPVDEKEAQTLPTKQ